MKALYNRGQDTCRKGYGGAMIMKNNETDMRNSPVRREMGEMAGQWKIQTFMETNLKNSH